VFRNHRFELKTLWYASASSKYFKTVGVRSHGIPPTSRCRRTNDQFRFCRVIATLLTPAIGEESDDPIRVLLRTMVSNTTFFLAALKTVIRVHFQSFEVERLRSRRTWARRARLTQSVSLDARSTS